MKLIFTLGGFGNVFIQRIAAGQDAYVSEIFNSDIVRSLLRHAKHPVISDLIISKPKKSGFVTLLGLVILCLDLPLALMIKKTMFTNIDLRIVKASPLLSAFVWIGYFQKDCSFRKIRGAAGFVKIGNSELTKSTMHIRGGDFIDNGAMGLDYYTEALKVLGLKEVKVVTDDVKYVHRLIDNEASFQNLSTEIHSSNAVDDFVAIRSSKTVIISNSTFSLVAALSSPTVESVVYPLVMEEWMDISGFNVRKNKYCGVVYL